MCTPIFIWRLASLGEHNEEVFGGLDKKFAVKN
jgi:hypothetical protein